MFSGPFFLPEALFLVEWGYLTRLSEEIRMLSGRLLCMCCVVLIISCTHVCEWECVSICVNVSVCFLDTCLCPREILNILRRFTDQ